MLEEIVSKKPIATIGSYSHGIKFRNMMIASDPIPVDPVPQGMHSLQAEKESRLNTCSDAMKKGI